MNEHHYRRRLGLTLALGAFYLLVPSTGRAGLLPVTFQPQGPVITGSGGGLTYNAGTGDFNATLTGSTLVYAAPFVQPSGFSQFSGALTIDLQVNKNGQFVANGTGVKLTGTVSINGATFTGTNAKPLLTGSITDFGSTAAGPPTQTFDGYFTITGGALTQKQPGTGGKPVFGGFTAGTAGGFILSAENVTSGTLGDFSRDFSSSSVKPGIGPIVPEPSSLILSLTAAVAFGTSGLWRKRLQLHMTG